MLTILFNRQRIELDLDSNSTLLQLQASIYQFTQVSIARQSLIFKGKKLDHNSPSSSLSELGLKHQDKITLIGTIDHQLRIISEAADLRSKKQAAYYFHAARPTQTLRTTAIGSIGDNSDAYSFHKIVPFPPSVPCLKERSAMLDRLSQDPAIRQIMISRKYQVGVL